MSTRSRSTKPDILDEASEWFVEFRAGNVSTSTRARFNEWLRQSPEHIQAYLDIAAGWSELPTADPADRIERSALVERARASPDDHVVSLSPGATVVRRVRHPFVSALAVAQALLPILFGLASWCFLYRADGYSTGVGEQRSIWLADGSTIELNACSTVRVRLSKRAREIELTEGQALFHVAKDQARPFIVRSGGATVRAVGTQFDVYRRTTGTVVTVVEGRVAVAESRAAKVNANDRDLFVATNLQSQVVSQSSILLSAGEQAIVTAQKIQRPRRADVAAATAWVQKRLIFEGTPLGEVAEQFNRYNTRRLVVATPELRALVVNGVYSSADPQSLIGFLQMQSSLLVTVTDQEIRVVRREQK